MMCDVTPSVEIKYDKRGFYSLKINGQFAGNFDTVNEAAQEAEVIIAQANA